MRRSGLPCLLETPRETSPRRLLTPLRNPAGPAWGRRLFSAAEAESKGAALGRLSRQPRASGSQATASGSLGFLFSGRKRLALAASGAVRHTCARTPPSGPPHPSAGKQSRQPPGQPVARRCSPGRRASRAPLRAHAGRPLTPRGHHRRAHGKCPLARPRTQQAKRGLGRRSGAGSSPRFRFPVESSSRGARGAAVRRQRDRRRLSCAAGVLKPPRPLRGTAALIALGIKLGLFISNSDAKWRQWAC